MAKLPLVAQGIQSKMRYSTQVSLTRTKTQSPSHPHEDAKSLSPARRCAMARSSLTHARVSWETNSTNTTKKYNQLSTLASGTFVRAAAVPHQQFPPAPGYAEIDLFFRCNPLFQSRFPLAWTGAGTGAGAGGGGGGGGERVQLRTHTTPRARQTVPDCDDET